MCGEGAVMGGETLGMGGEKVVMCGEMVVEGGEVLGAKFHNFADFPEPIMSPLLDMFTASTYN